MVKLFQKALLICPEKYSFYNSTIKLLDLLSEESMGYDIRDTMNSGYMKVQTQIFRFPFKVRSTWEKRFLKKVNKNLLRKIEAYNPDLVLVYNSEYLLPETCAKIKRRAKLIFFMGDSPFFTHTNSFYLSCLFHADLILSPDTFWINQLKTIGIHKTSFFVPGLDEKSYYQVSDKKSLEDVESLEVLYTGACYVNSWGYKKAFLMSQFTGFDFKLYGNSAWKRWFRYFPNLQQVYSESGYIQTERLNKMFNKAKIIPVDGNPAILNGFHLRLFEALGAGALPLIEYRKDVDELLFRGCDAQLPIIDDYTKAGAKAKYYLVNENERKQTVQCLRDFVVSEYNPVKNAERLMMVLQGNK